MMSGEEALALAEGKDDYVALFWCLVAADLDVGEASAMIAAMQEHDLVAPEDVTLAHFQLACWYARGLHVDPSASRAREHLEQAAPSVNHGGDVEAALSRVRDAIGLPDDLDIERPLGPAMPDRPGWLHRDHATMPPLLPAKRPKPSKKSPLALRESVSGLGVSPDGKTLLSGGVTGEIVAWDLHARTPLKRYKNAAGCSIDVLAYSPDGKLVLTGGESTWVTILDLGSNDYILLKRAHKSSVKCVGWLEAGKRFVTADHDGVIHVWDAGKRKVTTSASGQGVWALAISPDEKLIACGGSDRRVHLRRASDLELVASLEPPHGHLIEGLAFSPDGATLLSASRDDTIGVWNVKRRALVHHLKGHESGVLVVRSMGAGRAVSGGLDGRLLGWDLATGQSHELARGQPVHDVAVASGVVITGTDDGARFVDVSA